MALGVAGAGVTRGIEQAQGIGGGRGARGPAAEETVPGDVAAGVRRPTQPTPILR